MSDETIFAAAVEKLDSTERSAYLDSACAGNADQRKRLDALLTAHDRAGEFLARPAVAPPEPEHAPTRAFSPDPGADHTRTHGGVAETDTDDALGFLAPPRRSDSLGRIGHYEVLEILGRGGFGIVFRAFDEVLQRVVAVKVLAPSMAVTSPARKRFLREARSSASVRHENVVHVYAVEEQPLPYLVMEFIPGETLQQRLDRTGPLDVPEILRIGRQIALGLTAAHDMGLIHRDIKPSNILIDNGPQERVKITDFGLARAADDASISQSGVVAGTPMYMAPEQAKGDALDHRADLFSLGSVLYVMCTGRPPFRASGTLAVLKRVCEESPRPIREVIPEVPGWLCRIIEKLHAKDPAERFQSAKEVADLLADCEAQLKASAEVKDLSRIPECKPVPRRSRRRKWIAAAAGVLATGAIAAAVFFPSLWRGTDPVETRLVVVNVEELDGKEVRLRLAVGKEFVFHRVGEHQIRVPVGQYQAEWISPGKPVLHQTVYVSIDGETRLTVRAWPVPPAPDGWVSLFNGKDLTGWKIVYDTKQYRAGPFDLADGILIAKGQPEGYVRSLKPYHEFHLRLEYRTPAVTPTNLGLYGAILWEMEDADAAWPQWPPSMRLELGRKDGNPFAILYDTPAERSRFPRTLVEGTPAGAGEWNWLEIICKGGQLEVVQNGKRNSFPNYHPRPGFLALQSAWEGLQFRKIEIQELPPSEPKPLVIKAFTAADKPLNYKFETVGTITPEGDGWKIVSGRNGTTPLFGLGTSNVQKGTLTFRAKVKSANLPMNAYLEMGLMFGNQLVDSSPSQPIRGVSDWAVYESSFVMDENHIPDGATLNLVFESRGTVWIKDVEVLYLPAPGVVLPPAKPADAWVPLFNGKDLTGWKTRPELPGIWRVEEGALVGRYDGNGYLFSERGDYENFHLRAEVKIGNKSNGGLLFRCESGFSVDLGKAGGRYPLGYEVDIIHSPAQEARTGSLWRDGKPAKLLKSSPVRPDTWFALDVIAQGNHVLVKIDGKEVGSYLDQQKSSLPRGHIGLQVTWPETSVIQFRKIEIKELPASPKTPEQIAREDSARLVGEWIVRDGKVDQRALTAQPILERKLSFLKDGRFLLPIRDDSGYLFPITGVYTLDTAKKQITFNVQGLGNFVRCAYHVDGDTLVLDFPEPKDGDGQTELFAFGDQRLASQAHLKALGIAMLNYADKHSDALPPAAITDPKDKEGKPLLSWRVALLPYLNQESLYKEFKLDEPWDSEHNKKLIEKMPKVYAIPGAAAPRGHSHYRVFVGPGTAFEPRPAGAKGLRTIDFLDGLSSTILVVEAADPVIWTRPVDLPYDPRKPLPRLGTFQDGAQVLMADATVWQLSSRATEKDIRGAIEHSDGRGIAEQLLKRFPSRGPAIHLELQRQIAPPQPFLLKSFDPAREKAVAPRGDPKFITVENGAWRIENALADSMSGNFNVLLATVTENIPADGIVICRAKVKLQPKDKNAWGDLMLGQASPSFHGYNWPKQLAEYRGEITEWTQKEVRYPVEVFRKSNPPSIPIHVGLHANGVLWVKDLELLYLPAPSNPAPPAAVAPFDAAKAKELQDAWAKHLGVPVETTNSIGMKLNLIPPGTFNMAPSYQVAISKPFRMGMHEVTIGQFRAFVAATNFRTDAEKSGGFLRINDRDVRNIEYTWKHPSVAHSDNHPVVQLSWQDAVAFCDWLSKKEGKKYRLPTEAEWEWACRAGSVTRYSFGDDPKSLGDYAWYVANAEVTTHPVGLKKPNAWGLHDMHGNAAEYCLDRNSRVAPTGKATDPRGPAEGGSRVIRGFGYIDKPEAVVTTARAAFPADLSLYHFGFRVVCEDVAAPPPPPAVAPFDAAKARELQEAWAKHLGVPVETTNSIGMKLRLIPPGEFTMGSAKEEIDWLLTQAPDLKDAEMFVKDWVRSEGPGRRMTIGEPFLLGAHEVTVGEFRMFVKATGYKTDAETAGGGFVWNVEAKKWERKPDQVWSNPQYSGGENHPVKFVTSDDVRAFCAWLGKQDGRKYVIPTEEQWEYACRAGTATRWSFGDDPAPMRKHGWTVPHASGKHHPVGQLAANPFGLFDMYGNAGELVLTAHGEEYQRGGTAGESPLRGRSASRVPVRGDLDPIWTRGFRVAVVGDLKGKLTGDPAALQPLRDLVAATAHTRDTVKARLEAGRVSRIDLLVAEASLTEARIRLARAQGDRGAVIGLHEVLVALRREERNLIAERVKAGVAAENELNQADARLADARARLAKEKPPSPVAPAPRQKP